jgi:exopolysaccharide biosynthesis predicted pyruvyltransferase EpsI
MLKQDRYVQVLDVLGRFKGEKVYLHEVSGNNGDELILKGSEFLIEQAGCLQTDSPDDAKALLINGGFKSDFWPFANDTIREFCEKYPDKLLVILPSSFLYEKSDFGELFKNRNSGVVIFAREKPSLERAEKINFPCDVEFGLDHDTAFALRDKDEFRQLRLIKPDIDVLVVERGDAERVSDFQEGGVLESSLLKQVATRVMPAPVKNRVARTVGQMRRRKTSRQLTPFTSSALRLAESKLGYSLQETMIDDVSRRSSCDFDGFCNIIARSKVVVSTRLHVAVLSAILDRETYIVAGAYHKIPGIYAYSMADLQNVTMVSAACEEIE